MCSIILLNGVVADAPIVLGANRDERYDRPARPPAIVEQNPTVVAPLDEQAGGTWIGVNEYGLLVALANRDRGPEPTRSRGWLVREALRCETVEDAEIRVKSLLEQEQYYGCYVLLVDPTVARIVAWDGAVTVRTLNPGTHVVVNEGFEDVPAAQTVKEAISPPATDTAKEWRSSLQTTLRNHDRGICVHRERSGTCSSSVITWDNDDMLTYLFADGPPCETDFQLAVKAEL